MLSHRRRDKFSKIAGMNAQIVLSWIDFWTVTLMWKNGQNETEHSTWVLLLIGKTVHRWWSKLSVARSGQMTKQSVVLAASSSAASFVQPYPVNTRAGDIAMVTMHRNMSCCSVYKSVKQYYSTCIYRHCRAHNITKTWNRYVVTTTIISQYQWKDGS